MGRAVGGTAAPPARALPQPLLVPTSINCLSRPPRPCRFAPFFSGSGYGSEALSYVDAMLARGRFRAEDVWVTHAGDAVAPAAVRAMEPGGRALLERQVRGVWLGARLC